MGYDCVATGVVVASWGGWWNGGVGELGGGIAIMSFEGSEEGGSDVGVV